VPVVFVTARDLAGLQDRAELAHFDHYLTKPFDFLMLNAIIEELFSRCHPRHFADS
jgi:DNA-binding response OmpR family regulator